MKGSDTVLDRSERWAKVYVTVVKATAALVTSITALVAAIHGIHLR